MDHVKPTSAPRFKEWVNSFIAKATSSVVTATFLWQGSGQQTSSTKRKGGLRLWRAQDEERGKSTEHGRQQSWQQWASPAQQSTVPCGSLRWVCWAPGCASVVSTSAWITTDQWQLGTSHRLSSVPLFPCLPHLFFQFPINFLSSLNQPISPTKFCDHINTINLPCVCVFF
jgi:hypothetical protein